MTQQPEAQRWAYLLERQANEHGATDYKHKAAAELRRLYTVNEQLLEVLEFIPASGSMLGAQAEAKRLAAIAAAKDSNAA